ncbi:hypothetical protein [Alkalihalobacillus pseudalcaliphilus]|uniref:hypothetical protein n=1 Tax=Alkalihalobacillus pseudalcaliphilus TaxID=79884 RepID=UPI000B2CC7C0
MDEADDDKYSLIPEKEIYYYIGVSKEDAKKLIQDHADIPHIKINGTNYFPKEKLRQWLKEIG